MSLSKLSFLLPFRWNKREKTQVCLFCFIQINVECLVILNIIMAQESVLPKISKQTRDKLEAYGFVNHLYDYLHLPTHYAPRTSSFNSYTYFIMAISATGAVLSRRFGFEPHSFVFAFLAAPTMSYIQKRQADQFFMSEISRRNPRIVLQQFPVLNESFREVNRQVEEQIARVQQRVRLLQQISKRNQA